MRHTRTGLGRSWRHGLPVGLTLLVVLAAVLAVRGGMVTMPWSQGGCTVRVDGRTVSLGEEQAQHAATIAGVAVRRGLPARAVTIALATAYQESNLRNLDHGDRDSLGLFQQRPSQGWGSQAQVRDPVHATTKFYDALVRIDDYRNLAVTEAAQRVQRSAFPRAYADHEADARVLASALTGNSPAALACTVPGGSYAAQQPGASGLTPRAAAVRRSLEGVFGRQALGGFAPGGVRTGHVSGSAHYDGRALDVFVRPAGDPTQNRKGWAIAQWAVANAPALAVTTVIYDDRIWTAQRGGEGWRPYDAPERSGDPAVLRHLDHVHIDVAAGS